MTSPSKIGVLTFHKCINYGSYWQARCLAEGLRSRGHDVELLHYHSESADRAEIKCAFQPRLPERASRPEMRAYSAKIRKFAAAISALPLSRRFSLREPETAPRFDAVVIGSDEVWNLSHPWYGGERIFYGMGLHTPRLISYAASFGSYSCHWGIHDFWADQLKRFDSLSVRDANSYWLVHGSTGSKPALVLDPCLQFARAIPRAEAGSGDPYLLVYGHGFPDGLASAATSWARLRGFRIVSVGYRNAFADVQAIDAGPLEFARLMSGARAVVTNFFHGCVFALLNSKPFATAVSDYRSNKVRDLTSSLGITRRIVEPSTSTRQVAELLAQPAAPATERIRELRQGSEAFLDAALA